MATFEVSHKKQNLKNAFEKTSTYWSKAGMPEISFHEPSHFSIFGGYIFKLR